MYQVIFLKLIIKQKLLSTDLVEGEACEFSDTEMT